MKPWLLFIFACLSLVTHAQTDPKALEQWKNDKYSMFIHWGVYSVLGGVWEGKAVTRGTSEQIRAHAAGLYSDTYEQVAKTFNPLLWNPDSVALLAKAAGMRSIVLTSKHHDGFCMFKTAYTKFNIVDATHYHRDVVKELAEACKRQSLRFGLYYSLIDWHFPEAYPISSSNSDFITAAHHTFNKNQIRELLTQYGPISELWFDMGSLTVQQSNEIRDLVHELQPNCMVSGRLGNESGDFCVMGDNEYPNYTIDTPWQTPASIYDETWGYRSWQERGPLAQKVKEKLGSLLKVVSRGGNYLLNIGPRGDGTIVEYEKEVLLNMGEWLQRNGEAVYGASASPFPNPFSWGEVTARGNKLYVSLLAMPANRTLTLPGVTGNVRNIYVLGNTRQTASYKKNNADIQIILPAEIKSVNQIPVIVVEFATPYQVAPANVLRVDRTVKNIHLNQTNAQHHYSIAGVDYNTNYRSIVRNSWTLELPKSTTIVPEIIFSEQERGKSIDLSYNTREWPVILDEAEPFPLPQNGKVSWGPMYANTIGWTNVGWSGVVPIDPAKPWGLAKNLPWKEMDWKNGTSYTLEAEPSQSWFVLQEITAEKNQPVLIEVKSGDAVGVWLNGQPLMLHHNPAKTDSLVDVVLLNLRAGKNQLLVKLYNRYQDHVPVYINYEIPQQMFRKRLSKVSLQPMNTISWKLHDGPSPHHDLRLPNLSLNWNVR